MQKISDLFNYVVKKQGEHNSHIFNINDTDIFKIQTLPMPYTASLVLSNPSITYAQWSHRGAGHRICPAPRQDSYHLSPCLRYLAEYRILRVPRVSMRRLS